MLDTPYELTPEQVKSYQENGHILLRNVLDKATVDQYRTAITAAVKRPNGETRPLAERDTYGKAFLQTINIWESDEAVKAFVMAKRFAQIAGQLMGVDGIRLYHDQALYKEAGGGFTPWHQDRHYWPLDTSNTITMWMPLVDLMADMGIMKFASRSHTGGYLGDLGISDKSEAVFEQFVEEKGFGLTQAEAMAAGDATFHSGWTLHNAPGNASDRMREVMTVIYFQDGIRIAEPDNNSRANDLARYLPGQKPGELAGSELNPVLYKA